MPKVMDLTNLNNIATDPIADKAIGAILGTQLNTDEDSKTQDSQSKTEKNPSNAPKGDEKKSRGKSPNKKKNTTKKSPDAKTSEDKVSVEENKRNGYNYHTEAREVDGVGLTEKVISENGKVIGRPNVPTKQKKKPITLTLSPALYDKVKELAAADHRTTSEFLAMIIEKQLSE